MDTMVSLAKGGPWDAFYMAPASIDVRDVATAHILAAENPSANVCPLSPLPDPSTIRQSAFLGPYTNTKLLFEFDSHVPAPQQVECA